MKESDINEFRQLKKYFLEWTCDRERSIQRIYYLLSNAGEAGRQCAGTLSQQALELNILPEVGKTFMVTLFEYTGKSALLAQSWFDLCAIVHMTHDALKHPLKPFHGGIFTLIAALDMHYGDKKSFIPYDRPVLAFFPRKDKNGNRTAMNLHLRKNDPQDRFNIGYGPVDAIGPQTVIASLWEV